MLGKALPQRLCFEFILKTYYDFQAIAPHVAHL